MLKPCIHFDPVILLLEIYPKDILIDIQEETRRRDLLHDTTTFWGERSYLLGVLFIYLLGDSLVAQMAKHLPAIQETRVQSLGQEDPLEKEIAWQEFSRQEYGGGLLCPLPGDLPAPGIKHAALISSALTDVFVTTSNTWEVLRRL